MGKPITIQTDSTKILIAVIALLLFYAGYKLFVSEEWEMPITTKSELLKIQIERDSLLVISAIIAKRADSLNTANKKTYEKWQKSTKAYTELKSLFDAERGINSNLSASERSAKLSKWLQSRN